MLAHVLLLVHYLVFCAGLDKKGWGGLPEVPRFATKSHASVSHNRIAKSSSFPSTVTVASSALLAVSRGGGQDRDYDSSSSNRYEYEYEGDRGTPQGGRGREEFDYQENNHDYGDEDTYQHDDGQRGYSSSRGRQQGSGSGLSSKMPSQRKLGSGCLAAGSVLMLLGVSLFFNKTLLRLGNILLLVGVPLMFGPSKTMGYFLQPAKARATACLAVGIILVILAGRPILGIAMQVFGLLNLFGNMFPMIKLVLSQMPVVGDLFKANSNKSSSSSNKNSYGDRDSDYRENERAYY